MVKYGYQDFSYFIPPRMFFFFFYFYFTCIGVLPACLGVCVLVFLELEF